MYRVRFHLAAGKHFRMWQVRHPDGTKTYHHPDTTCLIMDGCYLRNSRRTAERIHAGARKTVCAWVLCRGLMILANPQAAVWPRVPAGRVSFNPRVMPHWHDVKGTDIDGTKFHCVMSHSRELYGFGLNLIG
jgi:hypothetical protein